MGCLAALGDVKGCHGALDSAMDCAGATAQSSCFQLP